MMLCNIPVRRTALREAQFASAREALLRLLV